MTQDEAQAPQAVRELVVTLPPAFEAFHAMYLVPYLKYAHIQLGSREAAGEVVEQTFTHLAMEWPHVMSRSNPQEYAWAVLRHRIAARLMLDRRSLALVETAAFTRAVLQEAQARFTALESDIGLYAAIARLPERQFDVIVLRFVLGYPTAMTARVMGVVDSTVRSLLRLARGRLARDLDLDDLGWEDADGRA